MPPSWTQSVIPFSIPRSAPARSLGTRAASSGCSCRNRPPSARTLACAADFRIGAAGSRFTTAFTGIGLTADSGLSWTLPRLVGAGRAAALLLLAEPFTAEQALEMGLLNAAVAPESVLPAALELAERLSQGPTAAYACVKASLRSAADSTLIDALAEEDRLQTLAGRTQDHAAAVRSFLAKQPATFTGR